MIVYQLFTGEKPFAKVQKFSIPRLVLEGQRPQVPRQVDATIHKLILNCIDESPARRPSCDTIVSTLLKYLKQAQKPLCVGTPRGGDGGEEETF